MKRLIALAALVAAVPASAGPWVDDKGRSMEMQFPGAPTVTYRANGHALKDGVQLFDRLCLKTALDRAAVEAAAGQAGWGFEYRAEMMPFKEPVDVGGWNSTDATLRMASGTFFNKKAQCSFVFAPEGESEISAVQEELTTLLGKAPDNAAKQFDKNGKPKRYYTPEWSISGTDGAPLKVFAYPLPYNSGAIQIAALKI